MLTNDSLIQTRLYKCTRHLISKHLNFFRHTIKMLLELPESTINRIYFFIHSEYKPISLGGWCGPGIQIRTNFKIYNEAYPFDQIRCSFEGVCKCLKYKFKDFFPTPPLKLEKIGDHNAYRGRYTSFFHMPDHDITSPEVQNKFQRRIQRLLSLLKTTNKTIIFIRTVTDITPSNELKQIHFFQDIVKEEFPKLKYKFVFIIHGQKIGTTQIQPIDSQTAVWCIGKDKGDLPQNYFRGYGKIIKFVVNKKNWPPKQYTLLPTLKKGNDLWYVDKTPMLKEDKKVPGKR